MSNKLPSIPAPSANITSIYQSVLAMRQALSLLTLNAQATTATPITQSSQMFSKTQQQIDDLQARMAALERTVTGLMK